MVKFTCIMLTIILVFSLIGCGKTSIDPEHAVSFYYCTPAEDYESVHIAILPELREGAGYDDDLVGLLNLYLDGPISESLISPFPDNCDIVSLTVDASEISVILNSNFAKLSGIDLIMASSCISYTLFSLTQCDQVYISADNSLLDGSQQITLHRDDLLLEYFSQ